VGLIEMVEDYSTSGSKGKFGKLIAHPYTPSWAKELLENLQREGKETLRIKEVFERIKILSNKQSC